ncbi:protein LTO1 homolog [Saccostrea echinata]|uniref:protein LTO1 homolog n=1 Tax=Saccostrea echinata TaxID=191078 RepID=UPI002A7FBA8D|nr:protein LTO1 homolog [Saccostrea echinata]XP_061176501.1 protein LTO1 homolog [Saccostrea echinata]XP_061176502.1 protein LTO1 homolog [Saccostrea echinata]XP_061176503.1 protein LTO1 homolog [Saccostrea echinata]
MTSNEDDIFHDIIMSEERFHQEGYSAGLSVGRERGCQEGCKLGWEKGAAIGSEIGFYSGFSGILLEKFKDDDKKQRVCKVLQGVIKLIEELPLFDPTNEELFDKLEKIRAKIKQVNSLLPINIEFQGAKQDVKGISF